METLAADPGQVVISLVDGEWRATTVCMSRVAQFHECAGTERQRYDEIETATVQTPVQPDPEPEPQPEPRQMIRMVHHEPKEPSKSNRVPNADLHYSCDRCGERYPRMFTEDDGTVVCKIGQCRPRPYREPTVAEKQTKAFKFWIEHGVTRRAMQRDCPKCGSKKGEPCQMMDPDKPRSYLYDIYLQGPHRERMVFLPRFVDDAEWPEPLDEAIKRDTTGRAMMWNWLYQFGDILLLA